LGSSVSAENKQHRTRLLQKIRIAQTTATEFHLDVKGLGQNVAKFCSKGQLVTVEGRIHYIQWVDQDGTSRHHQPPPPATRKALGWDVRPR